MLYSEKKPHNKPKVVTNAGYCDFVGSRQLRCLLGKLKGGDDTGLKRVDFFDL